MSAAALRRRGGDAARGAAPDRARGSGPARLRRSRGGDVYTDDKAPVEWLIDRSIVDYAND